VECLGHGRNGGFSIGNGGHKMAQVYAA